MSISLAIVWRGCVGSTEKAFECLCLSPCICYCICLYNLESLLWLPKHFPKKTMHSPRLLEKKSSRISIWGGVHLFKQFHIPAWRLSDLVNLVKLHHSKRFPSQWNSCKALVQKRPMPIFVRPACACYKSNMCSHNTQRACKCYRSQLCARILCTAKPRPDVTSDRQIIVCHLDNNLVITEKNGKVPAHICT